MNSNITTKTDSNVTLTITADSKVLEDVRKHTLNHLRAKVKAPGFRPGKAPDHIVERELGDSAVQAEVLESAVTQTYAEAVKDHTLAVLAPPQISLTKFVPYTELEYTATVDVMPTITLPNYKDFKIKRPTVTVTTEEIDQTVEDLQKRLATKHKVERPAASGDEVVIDFAGTKDGKPVEGATAKEHRLELGSKTFIPGFEEELIGLNPGDQKTFDITFPKDYQASELAGQKVTFAVTLHEVYEVRLPEVDEKFVSDISPFKDVAELRDDIEKRIQAEKAEAAEREFEDKVLEELIAKSKLAVPQGLLKQQMARMKEELAQRLASSGLDMDKYLGVVKKSADELEAEMKPTAEKRVKLALVLNQVAREEGVSVTPAEIEAEVAHLRDTYKDPAMQAELADPSILEDVHNHLLASRTITKVLSYIGKS
jgi:trigger factor